MEWVFFFGGKSIFYFIGKQFGLVHVGLFSVWYVWAWCRNGMVWAYTNWSKLLLPSSQKKKAVAAFSPKNRHRRSGEPASFSVTTGEEDVVSHDKNHRKGMREQRRTGDERRIQFLFISFSAQYRVIGPYL